MRIREATPTDAEAMGRVMVHTFLTAHRGQIPDEVWNGRREHWTSDDSARAWERAIRDIASGASPGKFIFIAETEDGEIVGVAMGVPAPDGPETTGEVCALYVHPEHQRRGVGRGLVAAAAARLAREGVTALQIAVLKANGPARRFYEALGGRVVGEREVEDEGVLLPEVVYGWPDIAALISEPAG